MPSDDLIASVSVASTAPSRLSARSLDQLEIGEWGRVHSIAAGDELSRRLLEIGFFPGAEIQVLAGMWPGHDPLAIRVGGSTFALRRREASLIRVIDRVIDGDSAV